MCVVTQSPAERGWLHLYVTSEDCDVSESLLSGEQDFTVRQERGPHSETGRLTLHSCGMPSGDMPSPLGSAAGSLGVSPGPGNIRAPPCFSDRLSDIFRSM